MPSSNEIVECIRCSRLIASQSPECSHCLMPFCYQCLIKHHHVDVRNEFIEMTHRIDKILAQFLHHAHNQTEWTCHLADDRNRLENYIRYMDNSYKQYPILTLPNYLWISHVHCLICKSVYSISEDCCKLMYPPSDFSIRSSQSKKC